MNLASKYIKYSKYKPSGVEWVDEIPARWEVWKIRKALQILTDFTANGSFASLAENVNYLSEGYSRLIRLTDLREDLGNDGVYVDEKAHAFLKKSELFGGELLLANVGAYTGLAWLVPFIKYKATLGPNMYLLKFKDIVLNKFMYYQMTTNIFFELFQIKASASAQPKINKRDVKDEAILLPPISEQKTIAKFLDRETGRIKKIVKKQTRMIELLKEKRVALITQMVTKGLDPKAKMKPSGIEWIGEIPENWDEERLCFLCSFNKGLSITKANLQDEGIPCVNYGEIHSKYGFEVNPDKDELKYVDSKYLKLSKKAALKYGDIIFADTSEDIEGAGNFTYFNSNSVAFAGYHTIIVKPMENLEHRYLAYLFESLPHRTQIRSKVTGIKVYSITKKILKDLLVIIPSRSEQRKIVEMLDNETRKIDKLVKKIEKQIEFLNEYEQSLITHAVTGKIDVRGEINA